MSLLKVLVYWLEENQWSVLSHTALRDEKALPGTSTYAKYGGKWYPSLIVANQSKDITEGEKQIPIGKRNEERIKTAKRKLESGLTDGETDSDQSDSLLSPMESRNKKTKKRLRDTPLSVACMMSDLETGKTEKKTKAKTTREMDKSRALVNQEISLMLLQDQQAGNGPLMERIMKIENNLEKVMDSQQRILQLFNCRSCLKSIYTNLSPSEDYTSFPFGKGSCKIRPPPVVAPSSPASPPPNVLKSPSLQSTQTSSNEILIEEIEENLPSKSLEDSGAVGVDELVYMGSPQFGIKVEKARLQAIEKTSNNPNKLALGLLELVINKEECATLSVYGQAKGKTALDTNKRKALRSHVFNRYHRGMDEAEKSKIWMDEIVVKMNDKIRAIKNNKYKLRN